MTSNTQTRLYEISIDLITSLLNALKLSHDFWSSKSKQAQYNYLHEYRDRLMQLAQFGNVKTA